MAVFKCKMCGGDLEVSQDGKTCFCIFCGTQQTLPKLDSAKKENLYSRANYLRQNNEFDKAMALYETILQEDMTDSEAYWSIVLCKYGIEYVEDKQTERRIPTCHRTQKFSIMADPEYRKALEYADPVQKGVYEREAKAIDDIQKGILSIVQNETPFDVFICYKESDDSGQRTVDSVLAQDIYYQLVNEGFRVFFARITLEDKLGTAYEPYIFSALSTSKVMVVVGTKPEYFNAVWVKNEWSRYLEMIRNGEDKIIIPAYKDMNPYDIPEELSHLQAQDMGKIGFVQDLLRGISKVCTKNKVEAGTENVNVEKPEDPIIKRAYLEIEDGNFAKADQILEAALNINPENAEIYLAKLLISMKTSTTKGLCEQSESFHNNIHYIKAMRFGDEQLQNLLEKLNNEWVENKHQKVMRELSDGFAGGGICFDKAFQYIAQLAEMDECSGNSNNVVSKAYAVYELIYENAVKELPGTIDYETLNKLEKVFNMLGNYKDSEIMISMIQSKKRKYKRRSIKTVIGIISFCLVICLVCYRIIPFIEQVRREKEAEKLYEQAGVYLENDEIAKFGKTFNDLEEYDELNVDVETWMTKLNTKLNNKLAKQANEYIQKGELDEFLEYYHQMSEFQYPESVEIVNLQEMACDQAEEWVKTNMHLYDAYMIYYEFNREYAREIYQTINRRYKYGVNSYNRGNYELALEHFFSIEGYEDSADYIKKCKEELEQDEEKESQEEQQKESIFNW